MSSTLQPQPRASLPTLPQELQDAIVRLIVDRYERGQGLLKLSYTCKRLRNTCLPIIYEAIKLYAYFDRSCFRLYRPERLLARSILTSSAHVGRYIRTLELYGVEPRDNIAEQMLGHMENLKNLIYRFEVQSNQDGLGTWPNTETLERALADVGQTLEHLEITYQFQGDEPRELGPLFLPGAVVSKQLVALKNLIMPLSLLLGWYTGHNSPLIELLPPKLERLSIHHDPDRPRGFTWEAEDVLGVLRGFVGWEGWRDVMPSLESITVHDLVWSIESGVQDKYREAASALLEQNWLRYFASREGIFDSVDSDDLYD